MPETEYRMAVLDGSQVTNIRVLDDPNQVSDWDDGVLCPDDVGIGWTTDNEGKTWTAPEIIVAPSLVDQGDVTSATQTVQDLLDPSTPNPSVQESIQALAVLVASLMPDVATPTPDPSP